jgi:hypothetical protein
MQFVFERPAQGYFAVDLREQEGSLCEFVVIVLHWLLFPS